LSSAYETRCSLDFVVLAKGNRDLEVHMARKNSGYGRNWKKWLAIYAVVGVIAYAIIYLLLSTNGGGGGGGGLY
jgi:hypothetical protein